MPNEAMEVDLFHFKDSFFREFGGSTEPLVSRETIDIISNDVMKNMKVDALKAKSDKRGLTILNPPHARNTKRNQQNHGDENGETTTDTVSVAKRTFGILLL